MIDLRCTDAQSLINSLPSGSVDFTHLDPPWGYDNFGMTEHGAAAGHYDGLPIPEILRHLEGTFDLAKPDTYALVWVTFPKLWEYVIEAALFEAGNIPPKTELDGTFYEMLKKCLRKHQVGGWRYITGGAWGKANGMGIGFHVRGDAEFWLLYAKGSPRPLSTQSNLILAPRIGHSEKPQEALRAIVGMTTPIGGLVLDLYAGASASMARACRATGRQYVGAEIDPIRHSEALRRFALDEQSSMVLGVAR